MNKMVILYSICKTDTNNIHVIYRENETQLSWTTADICKEIAAPEYGMVKSANIANICGSLLSHTLLPPLGNSSTRKCDAERAEQRLQKKGCTSASPAPSCPSSPGDKASRICSSGEKTSDTADSSSVGQKKISKVKQAKKLSSTTTVRRSTRRNPRQQSKMELVANISPAAATTPVEPAEVSTEESAPRPQRKATAGFKNVLAEIVEDEFEGISHDAACADDGDRNVGGYQWNDGEWDEWKKQWSQPEPEDEFEMDNMPLDKDLDLDSDDKSIQMMTTPVDSISKSRVKVVKKPVNATTKKTGVLQKRHQEPKDDSEDSESNEGRVIW